MTGVSLARRVAPRPAALPAGASAFAGRLKYFSPQEVEIRNRLLGALSALRVVDAGQGLTARVSLGSGPSGDLWLQFRSAQGQLAIAPEVVCGQPAVWPDRPRGLLLPEAVAVVSALEPVLLALEVAGELGLDPCGFGPAPAWRARLELIDAAGERSHLLWLAMEESVLAAWPSHPAPGSLVAGLTARASLSVLGPRVSRGELSLLEVGDIVLLPPPIEGAWQSALANGRSGLLGQFQPRSNTFTPVSRETLSMSDVDAISVPFTVPVDVDAWAPADLPVQLNILIADLEIPVAKLASLVPGGILGLPDVASEPEVQVLANGRRLASGRLVAVGEGYGVLIDQLAG